MRTILLYGGAAVISLWGVGHLVATNKVVSGFGEISADNRRILRMEWVAEGVTLCFLGLLVALTTAVLGPQVQATGLVARSCAAMLLVLALVSAFNGGRTAILPMKLCPYVKSVVAAAFLAATLVP